MSLWHIELYFRSWSNFAPFFSLLRPCSRNMDKTVYVNEGRTCIKLNLQPLVSNCREPIYFSLTASPFFLRHNYCFFVLLSLLLLLPFFPDEFGLHCLWQGDIVQCDTRKHHMPLLSCDHLWRLPFRTIPTALWSSLLSDLSLFAEVLILLNSWPICLNFRWFSPCEEPRRKQLHHYAS